MLNPNKRAWISALVAVAMVFASGGALPAQDDKTVRCDRDKDFDKCYQKLRDARSSEKATSDVTDKAGQEVAAKTTPTTNPGTMTSVLDFLPSVLGSLGFESLNDSEGNLNFDQNIGAGSWRIRLGGTVFMDSEVDDGLRDAIPEEGRADRVTALNEQIGDFDKVDFRVVVTKEISQGDHRYGRDADDYRDILQPIVADSLRNGADKANFGVVRWRNSNVVDSAANSLADPGWVTTKTLAELDGLLDPETVNALEKNLVDRSLRAKTEIETQLKEVQTEFGELIANQPQFYAEGIYRQRKALTGADESSFRLCYEMGLAGNVNDYLQWANKTKEPDCNTGNNLKCFEKWQETFEKSGDNGNRLAVALEYKDTQELIAPEDVADFRIKADRTYSAVVTYGRYFDQFSFFQLAGKPNDDRTRFDLSLKWDDVEPEGEMVTMMNDGALLASPNTMTMERNSRFVATATFSQGMTDNTVVSVSFVYANKSEFLGEVDKKWSANFGLRWKRDAKK